jgi:hypothetical protein
MLLLRAYCNDSGKWLYFPKTTAPKPEAKILGVIMALHFDIGLTLPGQLLGAFVQL